jgi:Leucine-rich repeat (LRR) protein
MQDLQSLPDDCLIELLSFVGDYKELVQLGFKDFITRYPRCVIKVSVIDNTVPENIVENAKYVYILCKDYKLPPVLKCEKLWCFNNKLTSLPDLPNCKELNCGYNYLTSLPDLPNCERLSCFDNQLTFLPYLPKCEGLNCNDNQLTSLPDLPNCRELCCLNNQLNFLPDLL